MQEEILFQGRNLKTISRFFTNFSGQTSDDDMIYYVITDINNRPIKLADSEFYTKFNLNVYNYNIPLDLISTGYKIYSGTVVTTETLSTIDSNQKQFIIDDYITRINSEANIDPLNLANSINNIFSYVFFEDFEYTDYFLNVKLNRSIDVLNTLNVYNVPTNESTRFTNDTGVLYGKIEALQLLLDDDGNKIKIPIKNANVAIFNPSEEFPSIGSVDENSNRMTMNLLENMETINGVNNLKSYGSFQSYLTDISYTIKDLENDKIPPKFKYTALTNEYGEFILHNIPVGQQTLMVEIDLLKQGLEPEEVALNFFPYPLSVDPNISTIPHLYFNQIPVNIVPSWGDFQTGFTEINLTVSLDLRKWITYFTYPISAKIGNPSEISNVVDNIQPKILEELQADGTVIPLTVKVRDMTKPLVYDVLPKVEIVPIINIYDKNLDLKCSWNEEFKIKNNKIEFDSTNYNAFKLPANLYDPNGFDTNGKKGVWLGAYQIKVFYPGENISSHSTGYAVEWPTNPDGSIDFFQASHFDLNLYPNWQNEENSPKPGAGVGVFPYEKPWSLNYPEPYIITKKPSVPNPLKSWNADGTHKLRHTITNSNGQSNEIVLTEKDFFLLPRYIDGDLVGGNDAWATNANGYGLQRYGPNQIFGNQFSREVTKNEIWRYENTYHWSIEWSNGYNQQCTPSDFNKYPDTVFGKPSILGERYQRIEAGYAYWLKPTGWPRIDNTNAWGDLLLKNDYDPLAKHDYNLLYDNPTSYRSYFPNTYLYRDEVTLQVGNSADIVSKFGRLDIYRIEKPFYTNPQKPPFVANYAEFRIGSMYRDEGKEYGTQCHPGRNKTGCSNDSGRNDTATAFVWLQTSDPAWNTKNTTGGYELKCNSRFWYNNWAFPSGHDIRIINIGSTKIRINEARDNTNVIFPSKVLEDGAKLKIYGNDVIVLPANDKYNPLTNEYEGASYLFYFGRSDSIWGDGCSGGWTQPVYKYAVGPEGKIPVYHFNSMISREVGIARSRCKAVDDYNVVSGVNWGQVFGAIAATFAVVVGVFYGGASFIILAFDENARKAYFDTVRAALIQDSTAYSSEHRRNNNIGVFLNGLAFVAKNFRYSRQYVDARGPLPYIGDNVKEARNLDLRNGVPYWGNDWWNRYLNSLSDGAGPSIFQPKRMYENNLKGTQSIPYFCEYIAGDVRLDYSTAF